MKTKATQRDIVFDVAKGISILLMTITHFHLVREYPSVGWFNEEVLMVFKIPLFIVVSGYLFSKKDSFKVFCASKFDALLKPIVFIFLVAGLIISAYYLSQGKSLYFIKCTILSDLVYIFQPLWFPIVLFFSLVLFRLFIQLPMVNDKKFRVYSFFALFFLLALFNQLETYYLLFRAYTMVFFVLFLFAGFLVNRRGLLPVLLHVYSFFFFLVLFVVCIFFRKELGVNFDLYSNQLDNPFTSMIAAFSGIIVVFNIARWISRFGFLAMIFSWCSQASFFILAFHVLVEWVLVRPLIDLLPHAGVWTAILQFILSISICILAYKLMFYTRFLKYLLLPLKSIGGN